jgi:hypothetical protein
MNKVVRQTFSAIFDAWSAGHRESALGLLRDAAMLWPKEWFNMMTRCEPPPGFTDDVVSLNQYDEYVVVSS